MKRLVHIVFLSSLIIQNISELCAQTAGNALNIDSLVKANEAYRKEDSTKLKMIIQLAKGYIGVNNAKGIESADQAIILAQKLDNEWRQAEALYWKAEFIYRKGDYRPAIVLYEQALQIDEKHNNLSGMCKNLRGIGVCYDWLDDYNKALAYLQRALSICEQLKDTKAIADNLTSIAQAYRYLSDLPSALKYEQRSLEINQRAGNKTGIANNYSSIGNIYSRLADYPLALKYLQNAVAIHEELGNKNSMAICFARIGLVYNSLSDYPRSLEYYQRSLTINEQLDNKDNMAVDLGNIGIIFYYLADYSRALEYHQKAFIINEQLGSKRMMASNLGNIGIVYQSQHDYPRALEYHQRAHAIDVELGRKSSMAINLENIGAVYKSLSDYPQALKYYQQALAINEQVSKVSLTGILISIGDLYMSVPDSALLTINLTPDDRLLKAYEYVNRGLELAREIGNISSQRTAWNVLSQAYEKQGQYNNAFEAYKNYIMLRDSITGANVKTTISQKEMQYEFDKKETRLKYEKQLSDEKALRREQELQLSQKELGLRQQALVISNKEKELQRLSYLKDKAELETQKSEKEKQLGLAAKENELLGKEKELQAAELKTKQQEIQAKNAQRNLFIAGTVLMLLLAGSVFVGLKRTQQQKKISEKLRAQSDNLLRNILPEETAEELKAKGNAEAKHYNEVTVMFTDFKNFTQASEKLSAVELVKEIHHCYSEFDRIVTSHNLEKIKTIGDSYMCAGGLPVPNTTNADDMLKAALEICEFMKMEKQQRMAEDKPFFEIRIGLHTGPVVAGIVGIKKFAYDIWGDTVNIASRMESSGEAGKVNISGTTYELVKDKFTCTYRGKIEAKNKGMIDMYFVDTKS